MIGPLKSKEPHLRNFFSSAGDMVPECTCTYSAPKFLSGISMKKDTNPIENFGRDPIWSDLLPHVPHDLPLPTLTRPFIAALTRSVNNYLALFFCSFLAAHLSLYFHFFFEIFAEATKS
jgi:hypothetical protein